MHDRLCRRYDLELPRLTALAGMNREERGTGRRFRLLLVPENLFRLDGLVPSLCRLLGLSCPSPFPELRPAPLITLATRFRFHLVALREWCSGLGLELEWVDLVGVGDLVETIQQLAEASPSTRMHYAEAQIYASSSREPVEDRLLRYLGILCDEVFIGPSVLHLDPANACSANCLFCGYHSPLIERKTWRYPGWSEQQLDMALFPDLVKDLRELHVDQHIAVAGEGEPCSHPHVFEMLRMLTEQGLRVSLYTNALRLDRERLCALVELGLDQMVLNVSAGTAETYQRIHPGAPQGFFLQLGRDLTAMMAHRRARGFTRTELVLKQVLTTLNVQELPAMVEQACAIGADVLYVELMHDTGNYTRHLKVGPDRLVELRSMLETAARRCQEHGIVFYDHPMLQLEAMLAAEKGSSEAEATSSKQHLAMARGCFAGWFFSRVYSDGQIGFCCHHRKLGTLRQNSFRDLWFSPRYHRFRLAAKRFDPAENERCDNDRWLLDEDCARCGNFHTGEIYYQDLRLLGLLRYVRR